MDPITLILLVVVFACVVWGLAWACAHFKMPTPVLWLVGSIVIIILILFLLKLTGLYTIHPILMR